jgi:hypothetical protein
MMAMEFRPTALEYAFALAKSGGCSGLADIRRQLQAEGYALHSLEGPALIRQLRELCAASYRPSPD